MVSGLPATRASHAPLDLLRLHVEAGWGVRLPPLVAGGEHACLPGGAVPEWAVYVALFGTFGERPPGGGERVRVRRDVGAAPETLAPLWAAADAALDADSSPLGITREVALHLAAPLKLDVEAASAQARPLGARDRAAVEAFEPGESPYYLDAPQRAPVIGAFLDARLAAIAHSSRRTAQACELGVDTAAWARRQGLGLAVTTLWTAGIRDEGLVPLYSARAENVASLALAHAAGYRPFARAAYLAALSDTLALPTET